MWLFLFFGFFFPHVVKHNDPCKNALEVLLKEFTHLHVPWVSINFLGNLPPRYKVAFHFKKFCEGGKKAWELHLFFFLFTPSSFNCFFVTFIPPLYEYPCLVKLVLILGRWRKNERRVKRNMCEHVCERKTTAKFQISTDHSNGFSAPAATIEVNGSSGTS